MELSYRQRLAFRNGSPWMVIHTTKNGYKTPDATIFYITVC